MDSAMLASDRSQLWSLDLDDLDTELDVLPWGRAALERQERARVADLVRARHDTLARAARPLRAPSLVTLTAALGRVAAFANVDRHVELFASGGLLATYLSVVYTAAHDGLTARPLRSSKIAAERRRLAYVADRLPDDVRVAVVELFIAFDRFERDFG
jgi:hypothetical protein